MKTNALIVLKTQSHTLSQISKVIGITPDPDSPAKGDLVTGGLSRFQNRYSSTAWTLGLPRARASGLNKTINSLLAMLPNDFASRLKSMRGVKGYLSIALCNLNLVDSTVISSATLKRVMQCGLSLELKVFSPKSFAITTLEP